MPKKVRLAINLGFSLILLIFLIYKIIGMISHWGEFVEIWGLNNSPPFIRLFLVFGIYPLIAVTALSVWLRGVPPIVLSALGFTVSIVHNFLESIFATVLISLEVTEDVLYTGVTPVVSWCTHFILFIMLVISIAELVIAKRKRT